MAHSRKYEYKNAGMKPAYERKAGETIEHYYRRLAKVADQRMVRLEAYQHDKGYANILQWAYARAKLDIKKWSGDEGQRFNTAMPKNEKGQVDYQRLAAKIRDIRTFLEAPTSTKAGIKELFETKAENFNKAHGTNFTWEAFAKFWDSGIAEKLDLSYGSKTKLKAIGSIQKFGSTENLEAAIKKTGEEYITDEDRSNLSQDALEEKIREEGIKHLKIEGNKEVQRRARKILEEQGLDILDLIGG